MYYSLLSLKMTSFVLFPKGSSFGSSFFLFPIKVAGGNPQPLVTALCTHYPTPTPTPTPLPHLEDLISILPK